MQTPAGLTSRLAWLLTLIIPVTIFIGLTQVLKISIIECQLNNQPCPSEITQYFSPLHNQKLLTIRPQLEELIQNLASPYQLHEYRLKFPHTLQIWLLTQQPAYQLQNIQTQETRVITVSGQVMGEQPLSNLITLQIPPDVWTKYWTSNSLVTEEHNTFSSIVQQLKNSAIPIMTGEISSDQTLRISLPENRTALLDIQELHIGLVRLELLLENLRKTPPTDPVVEIDVRYKLPVLRTTRSSSLTRQTSYKFAMLVWCC